MTKARHGGRNPRVTVEELIGEMHGTVDGLVEDGASRADLKLLSRALKELRHAFRFFDGFRKQPKVTVFGSARLTQGSPACRQAESFGRAMVRSGWFVVTGAGEGIMEAAHIGAGREILGFYRAFHSGAGPGDPDPETPILRRAHCLEPRFSGSSRRRYFFPGEGAARGSG